MMITMKTKALAMLILAIALIILFAQFARKDIANAI